MKLDSVAIVNKIKENLISFIILVVAINMAIKAAVTKQKALVQLEGKKVEELKKNKKIEDIQVLEKKLAELRDVVNVKSIESEQILKTLSQFAEKAQVKIALFNAKEKTEGAGFTRYSFELTLSADNYHQLGKFVDFIEHSPQIFFVETLSIFGSKGQKKTDGITASMTVSTITIDTKT